MDNLEWHSPIWFWLLLALPVVAFLRARAGRTASVLFSSTAIAQALTTRSRSRAGGILFLLRLLAVAAIITALARPREGKGYQEIESSGIDIVLAVDVSTTMLAHDFVLGEEPITRLEASKSVMESFIKKRPNDRIGLIAFAGYPYLVSPLTLNHDWLLKNLKENVRTGRIEDGTAIGTAIGSAVNRLSELEDAKSRVVILLTDGENNAGDIPPKAAAEAAATYDTRIYTIGVGSDHSVRVYLTDENGRIVRDILGQPRQLLGAVDPMNAETLREIARITRGQFYRATDTDELAAIYDEIDRLEKTEVKLRKHQEYEELFYVPALIALALLSLEILLANTRLRRLP